MRLCTVEGCENKHLAKGLCNKHYARKHYYDNIETEREKARFYAKKFSKTRKTTKKWHEKNKDKVRKYYNKRREEHPEIFKCYTAVRTKLRNGTLKKGKCVICDSTKTEAHHEDYSKPFDIVWLCKKHHGLIHRKCSND